MLLMAVITIHDWTPHPYLVLCGYSGARNGRLESLSGGSKQSHSSSKARQAVASQPHTLTPELQRVESDAESHPGHAHSHNGAAASSKQQLSPERQRTSDVSSRDVLEAVDDLVKVKDESQSQELAVVRSVCAHACLCYLVRYALH